MTFLELQLERISQSVANQQTNTTQISTLTKSLSVQEEKIVNISRLVKLLQSYSDAQEEDNSNLKAKVARLEDRVDKLVQ
jgi:hypothetical protein